LGEFAHGYDGEPFHRPELIGQGEALDIGFEPFKE
jgi:hypothetical protein